MNVIIRELKIADAEISWQWRNDPDVWKLTGRKWSNHVTKEIEKAWIAQVISNVDEKRFAICVDDEQKYVGNIQLTDIKNNAAEYHIFIGDKTYWGKGVASQATTLLLDYAREQLNLKKIYLSVNKQNKAARQLYKKFGFEEKENVDDYIYMERIL